MTITGALRLAQIVVHHLFSQSLEANDRSYHMVSGGGKTLVLEVTATSVSSGIAMKRFNEIMVLQAPEHSHLIEKCKLNAHRM